MVQKNIDKLSRSKAELKRGQKKKVDIKPRDIEKILPDMPKILSKTAQELWKKLAPKLFKLGVLTEIDVESFILYCESYSTYVNAKKKVETQQAVLKNKATGANYRNQWLDVMLRAAKDMERYQQYFGLNPSARSSFGSGSENPNKKNPFKDL